MPLADRLTQVTRQELFLNSEYRGDSFVLYRGTSHKLITYYFNKEGKEIGYDCHEDQISVKHHHPRAWCDVFLNTLSWHGKKVPFNNEGFRPAVEGIVRVPLKSSKGNPFPYQGCIKLPNGCWSYEFGKTVEEVKKGILQSFKDYIKSGEWYKLAKGI